MNCKKLSEIIKHFSLIAVWLIFIACGSSIQHVNQNGKKSSPQQDNDNGSPETTEALSDPESSDFNRDQNSAQASSDDDNDDDSLDKVNEPVSITGAFLTARHKITEDDDTVTYGFRVVNQDNQLLHDATDPRTIAHKVAMNWDISVGVKTFPSDNDSNFTIIITVNKNDLDGLTVSVVIDINGQSFSADEEPSTIPNDTTVLCSNSGSPLFSHFSNGGEGQSKFSIKSDLQIVTIKVLPDLYTILGEPYQKVEVTLQQIVFDTSYNNGNPSSTELVLGYSHAAVSRQWLGSYCIQ